MEIDILEEIENMKKDIYHIKHSINCLHEFNGDINRLSYKRYSRLVTANLLFVIALILIMVLK